MGKYKDPDYDPQKAHEYYMKHRHLKGRHSTKGMSQQQKEQWAYAKSQILEDRKKAIADENTRAKGERSKVTSSSLAQKKEISARKSEISKQLTERANQMRKYFSDQAKAKISSLRAAYANLPKEQKAIVKARVQGLISKVREELASSKSQVTEKTKEDRATISAKASEEKAKISESSKKEKSNITANSKKRKEKIKSDAEKRKDKAYKKIKNS